MARHVDDGKRPASFGFAPLWQRLNDGSKTTPVVREVAHPAQACAALTGPELVALHETWKPALAQVGITAHATTAHRIATALPNELMTGATLLTLADQISLVPLNIALPTAQLVAQVEAANADAVIVEDSDQGRALAADMTCAVFALRWHDQTPELLSLQPNAIGAPNHATGLVLHTSGSTGTPKRVPLTPDQILHSALSIAAHLNLGPNERAGHALPLFHIGALVDLMLAPLLAGGSVVMGRDMTTDTLQRLVNPGGATWLQLVPTGLSNLLITLDDKALLDLGTGLRFIRMVSADLTVELQHEAQTRLNTPLVQMYGMTETAGQIASNPAPPDQGVALSVGQITGPDVALLDDTGSHVAAGDIGEICLRGPTVMVAYEGDAQTPRFGPWLRSGDLGRLDDTGNLFLTGRVKEIINRGGEKISPLTIERAALSLETVEQAVAFALPHPTLGEQPGLAVVPTLAHTDLDEKTVLEHLTHHLAAFECPRAVLVLEGLPRLGSGKIDRRAVAAMAQQGSPESAANAPALSPLAQQVADLWSRALKCRTPYDSADFFDDGGDSLAATEFIEALETLMSRPLPSNLLFEAPRFGALVKRLETEPLAEDEPARDKQDFLTFLQSGTAGWKGRRVGPRQLIFAQNTQAQNTKVFYGANNPSVTNAFAESLVADYPFYMMRSLYLYPHKTAQDVTDLGALYAQEIIALTEPGEEIILAGFCGGADTLAQAAPLLRAASRRIRLFVALDHVFDTPTFYPVFHIWTDSQRFSPRGKYPNPRRAFEHFHPHGAGAIHIPGQHDKTLTSAKLAPHANTLAPFLSGTSKLPEPIKYEPIPHTERALRHSAKIRRLGWLPKRAGKGKTVKVRLTNTSSQLWPKSETSGLVLIGRYASVQNNSIGGIAMSAPLTHDLPPGKSVWITMPLLWPRTRRKMPAFLHLEMVDNGYARFDALKSNRAVIPVLPPAQTRRRRLRAP